MRTPLLIGLTGRKRSGKDTFARALVEDHQFDRVAFADPIKLILADLNPSVDGVPASGRSPFDAASERADLVGSLRAAVPRWAGRQISERHAVQILEILDLRLGGTMRLRRLLAGKDRRDWDHLKEGSDVVTPEQAAELRRLQQVLGTEALRGTLGDDLWVKNAMRWAEKALDRYQPFVITDCRFENEARAIREAGGMVLRIHRPSLAANADPHVSERALPDELVDLDVLNDRTAEDLRITAARLVAELSE